SLSCSRCGAHRHLPSFPTRRSSDLARQFGVARDVLVKRRSNVEALARDALGDPARGHAPGAAAFRARQHALDARLLDRTDDRAEDRKSTRLNSSHDQISYAVFCLKK